MGWLAKLTEDVGAIFSINIEPIDNAQLIEHLDARIRDASSLSKIAKNESIKQVREAEVKEASEIISRMINNNEVVSYLTIYICISAQNEQDLISKCKEVERVVQKLKLKIRPVTNFLLKSGFKAVAPFFTIQKDLTEYFKRNILTSSFTGGFLFNTNTFIDKEGYCFGINQNGGIIIFNIWKKDYDRTNSNMVIVGSSGSGKSLATKHIIYNELPRTKLLIIDPEAEYTYLANNLKGKIIECGGSNSGYTLNPLQVRINKDDEENLNALAIHFQFLHTFFEILFSSIIVITQSIEDFLNEKIKLYGQSLLANSTYKLFFKMDGQDLRDVVKVFSLSKKEEELIYNAKRGECLLSAGNRKIFVNVKVPHKELQIIDEHFKSDVIQ